MRIRARFLITLAVSLALSGCIAVVATSFLLKMRSTMVLSQQYEDVIQHAFSLSSLVDSLPLGYSPRIKRQLDEVKDSLDKTLRKLNPTDAEEEFLLRQMLRNDRDLGELLQQYLHNDEQPDSPQKERRKQLFSSQIRIKTRFITDDTSRLVSRNQNRLMAEQTRAGIIVAVLIASLAIINGATFYLANKRIIRGVRQLAQGADHIASGDLNQRIRLQGNDELAELAEVFNHMTQSLQLSAAKLRLRTQKLEQSNRDLEQFASLASHDLQEPLRKIKAFGDLLIMESGDELSPKAQDYLTRMSKAARRMSDLISALLAYSRVVRSQVPYAEVKLDTVVQEVLGDLERRIAEEQADVDVGPLPVLQANAMQMRQLFQNLISNALKYHSPDTPPRIRIRSRCLGQGPDAICHIEVTDNGIGMEEQYLEKIFTPFQRLHGRHKYEGTGIGLALCRGIAERHGGSISARSTPGSGSTFQVSLPVTPPSGSLHDTNSTP